jgi:hypothetical protein
MVVWNLHQAISKRPQFKIHQPILLLKIDGAAAVWLHSKIVDYHPCEIKHLDVWQTKSNHPWKTCWWLKGLTDTSKFVETWKPQEMMERSSKLKKPGNSCILSFSHTILNFPVCLRLPSKFSQGHTVTLHLPKRRNVILVSSVPRKHDLNRPYALLQFWKSQRVIEII